MKKKTYIVPRFENVQIECEYVKAINEAIYGYLKLDETIENQTIVNLLKHTFELSKGKLGYVTMDDNVIFQIVDYGKDGRMLESYFDYVKKVNAIQGDGLDHILQGIWNVFLLKLEPFQQIA